MNKKVSLKLTTALAFGALFTHAGTALAAAGQAAPDAISPATTEDDEKKVGDDDVIVVGIRGSVTSAVDKKKKAKQIVDSVVSEDAGKLPDNNVVEAMSRITGVQIERARGEGQSVTIRGLDGVQTTINGNDTSLGDGRALDLSSIPAELVKSIDVYKTRTADQVEGSIAGTVNVQLRRPFDLPKKWTVAGSVRGVYADISKKISPYASLIVANRFDTGIGEVGFLLNGSLTKTKYFETYVESESPDVAAAGTSTLAALPADLKNIVIPYRAYYGSESGSVTRPSINAVLQWKPNDNLEFVLEGGFLGSREERQQDRLYVVLRDYNTNTILTNIELQPDGVTLRKATVTLQQNRPPIGADSLYSRRRSNLYTSNFETHWTGERVKIDASAQYNQSDTSQYNVQTISRPYGITAATVDFGSSLGFPLITLDNGGSLTDPAAWSIERFQDLIYTSKNKEFAGQADLTLTMSDSGLLRSFQWGARYNHRDTENHYGYRDGYPRTGRVVNGLNELSPQTAFPGTATLTSSGIAGTQQWLRIPGQELYDNLTAIREYLQVRGVSTPASVWASELPTEDKSQEFTTSENKFAAYGQLNYAFDIGFPVEGVAGIRYVTTWGTSGGYAYRDVDGVAAITPVTDKVNYADILPSVTATLHFSKDLQLRLSYTTNVQRPSFYDIRPFSRFDPTAIRPAVSAGNPDLKAQRDQSFNASAEYFFGRGGILSATGYYKKASNYLYYTGSEQNLDEFGLPGVTGDVYRYVNAGDGKFIGAEGTAQAFFEFLPGILRNFGASANVSYIFKARVEYPIPEDFPGAYDVTNLSKLTTNAALFYDTPEFSARLSYNYRSPYKLYIWYNRPEYSWYSDATQRLDAAINFTPVKFLTLSLEATNLTGNDQYTYFGKNNLLPRGVRLQARTYQTSLRFRF